MRLRLRGAGPPPKQISRLDGLTLDDGCCAAHPVGVSCFGTPAIRRHCWGNGAARGAAAYGLPPCSPLLGTPSVCRRRWHGSPSPCGLRAELANYRRVHNTTIPLRVWSRTVETDRGSVLAAQPLSRFLRIGDANTTLISSPFMRRWLWPASPQEVPTACAPSPGPAGCGLGCASCSLA